MIMKQIQLALALLVIGFGFESRAATAGDKIAAITGTAPVINWSTEPIKTWTLSGNSNPTQSNVPTTTTQRFQLELLVVQPVSESFTISTPSGWAWLTSDWSALPPGSTNRIILEKIGSNVYAAWAESGGGATGTQVFSGFYGGALPTDTPTTSAALAYDLDPPYTLYFWDGTIWW